MIYILCQKSTQKPTRGGQWQLALQLLSSMQQQLLLPNEVTYGASISACAKGSDWTQALQLLVELMDGKLQLKLGYTRLYFASLGFS